METTEEAKELTILNGGVEILVLLLSGGCQRIKVRQLPLRLMPAYAAAQGDEGQLCALFCELDQEWVDGVTPESQEEIVITGDRLNGPLFTRWAERRMQANARLLPLLPQLSALAGQPPRSAPAAATPAPR